MSNGADLVAEMRFVRTNPRHKRGRPCSVFGQAREYVRVRSLPPHHIVRQVAGGVLKPAGQAFEHAAPRPDFQGLHERGLNDVLDDGEPTHVQRPVRTATSRPNSWRKNCATSARFAHA